MHFTIRSMIYFELSFMKDVKPVPTFIFLHMDAWSGTIRGREYLFCIALTLQLCQRSLDYIYDSLFLGTVLFHWSICSLTNTTLSCLLLLYRKSWSQIVSVFQLCSTPSIWLDILLDQLIVRKKILTVNKSFYFAFIYSFSDIFPSLCASWCAILFLFSLNSF